MSNAVNPQFVALGCEDYYEFLLSSNPVLAKEIAALCLQFNLVFIFDTADTFFLLCTDKDEDGLNTSFICRNGETDVVVIRYDADKGMPAQDDLRSHALLWLRGTERSVLQQVFAYYHLTREYGLSKLKELRAEHGKPFPVN